MKEIPGCRIEGEFNPQKFFDTLALILSAREGCKITAKVTLKDDKEEKKGSIKGLIRPQLGKSPVT